MRPVLEICPFEGFAPWPVARWEAHGFLPLNGGLSPAEVGTAVMRVTDTATGTTLLPGCCAGLEEWRDWFTATGGGQASFGHDPSPLVERRGDTVRLTVDAERDDSPVIELPVAELRRLLAGAEGDLAGFLRQAAGWAARHLPDHAVPVTAALARVLDLPAQAIPPKP